MRGRVVLLAIVAVVCLDVAGAVAAPRWIRLKSANFTLVGDVSNVELADVARHLEQFRQVVSQAMPQTRLTPPTPMTVVVFARQRDLDQVRPLYQGKPMDVAGFFTYAPDGAAIAISLERGDVAFNTVYHEFAHLMISNSFPRAPVWFGEGLAEFYGTFFVSADRRSAEIGRVPEHRVAELQERLIPLDQVLGATHDSPLYNDSSRRSTFYAESWALVHYLLLGNPARKPQLVDYLSKLSVGTPWPEAFRGAFGTTPETIGQELASYVRKPTFPALRLSSEDKFIVAQEAAVRPLSDADGEATIAGLFLLLERYPDAEARVRKALTLDPNSATAQTVMGLLRVRQGHMEQALPLLRRGADLAPFDAMAQYALGYALVRTGCPTSPCPMDAKSLETARTSLLKAVELVPDFPTALSLLGLVEMADAATLADAQRHLERAIELVPSREDYKLNLAQVYLRKRDYAAAQALLGPISAYSPVPGNQQTAREILGELARVRNAEREKPPSAGSAGQPPPGAAAGDDPSRPAPRRVPVYRKLGPDEQRVEGMFEAVECSRQAVVIRVREKDRVRRFWAPRFDAVEFITYRDDQSGSVGCGAQTPAVAAYLTWRPAGPGDPKLAAGIEGIVVAVEILPK